MKTVMRSALLMLLSLFLAKSALAEQYGCQAASSDFRSIYITSLFSASPAQSGQVDAQWKDYVARQYGGGMQTMCSIGDPATYNQAIQSARSGGRSVQVVGWAPSAGAMASSGSGASSSSNGAKKAATANRTTSEPAGKSNANQRKYRDGTTCIKLEHADSNGVSFWKNNCSFPVSISWADEQCTSGFACGTSLNVKPGGKDSVIVKGRYTAAACEYPGIVRDLDGDRWQPGEGRHSCK